MSNPNLLRCPGSDPVLGLAPESVPCPVCGNPIEIWTDEAGARCPGCRRFFKRNQMAQLNEMIRVAQGLGATGAAVVSTEAIDVDDALAEMCREPRCPSYGLSRSCPPHVGGPPEFREKLKRFKYAVFFEISIPIEIMHSIERRECFQLLHEIASGLEQHAAKKGFENARAFAGGSCKRVLCHDHPDCLALSKEGRCRNPEVARPSMSGFGINVAKLAEVAGFERNKGTGEGSSGAYKMIGLYGLVLVC